MFRELTKSLAYLATLQRKWSLHILFLLHKYEKMSFNMLKKTIRPITSKVLSKHLSQLLDLGLIVKNIVVEKPLKVEYYLSEKGRLVLSYMLNLTGIFKEEEK